MISSISLFHGRGGEEDIMTFTVPYTSCIKHTAALKFRRGHALHLNYFHGVMKVGLEI